MLLLWRLDGGPKYRISTAGLRGNLGHAHGMGKGAAKKA
jgi:hypothetical protein